MDIVWIYFIFFKAFLNNEINILFEFSASEPPLKITAFPDLKHKLDTSEDTSGLLSNIIPIIPNGIETFLINKLFGLFHLLIVISTGSFNLLTFFIAKQILFIFF